MMQNKEKPCKGNGKAAGFGCGAMQLERKYGLGLKCGCYRNWLLNSPEGKEVIEKTTLRASKKVSKEKKKSIKKAKDAIKRKSDYERELQTLINSIVRLIDNDKGCISCNHGWDNPWTRQKHAGHRISVGSTPELRFNVFNIHLQCSICNNWKSGNERSYDKGLINHYGEDYLKSTRYLRLKYPSLHITIPELKEAINKAKIIKKRVLDGDTLTRKEINDFIGIYK
jgi:hypothetical protein